MTPDEIERRARSIGHAFGGSLLLKNQLAGAIAALCAEVRTEAQLEEAAKHADCCVDREEMAALRQQLVRLEEAHNAKVCQLLDERAEAYTRGYTAAVREAMKVVLSLDSDHEYPPCCAAANEAAHDAIVALAPHPAPPEGT